MSRKIILDTDPGVGIPGTDADDAIALFLALAHPELELLAVTTTFGNCPPSLGARGARTILDALGRSDIPLGVGQDVPLDGILPAQLSKAYEEGRGRPGRIELAEPEAAPPSSVELIIDLVHAHPGEVTIVPIGPQTNLARAIELDPSIVEEIDEVVFMGGALGLGPGQHRGNITPTAECNIYFDPIAADRVFRSGAKLSMIGLDVTNVETGLVLWPDDLIDLQGAAASRAARLFLDICHTYLESPMFDHGPGCILYDPLAILSAAEPDVGHFKDLALGVETRGALTLGETVVTDNPTPNVRAMTNVDGRDAIRRILRPIVNVLNHS